MGGFYQDAASHYKDELRKLDLMLEMEINRQQKEYSTDKIEQFKGFVISEQEIIRLLKEDNTNTYNPDVQTLNELTVEIKKKVNNSLSKGIFLPFPTLSYIFDLTEFEQMTLLMCLAVELDRKYEKIFAFLQDDIFQKRPTLNLINKILNLPLKEVIETRAYFSKSNYFYQYFLNHETIDLNQHTLLSQPLILDERIVSFLLETEEIDNRIEQFSSLFDYESEELTPILIDVQIQNKLRELTVNFINDESESSPKLTLFLSGNRGSGKTFQMKHLCKFLKRNAIVVDLAKLVYLDEFEIQMKRVYREAILHQSLVVFQNFDIFLSTDSDVLEKLQFFIYAMDTYPGAIFLLSQFPWRKKELFNKLVRMNIPEISDSTRANVWAQFSENYVFSEQMNWDELATKFRYTPGQIVDVLEEAKSIAEWKSNSIISLEDIYQACYGQVNHQLEKKAKRIIPKFTWDDVILPSYQKEQLMNACNQIKYRHLVYGKWGFEKKLSYGKGLSMLFAGPPGTGKTMCAEIIARELHLEIYKVDLSQVISKYIGETEKNLSEIFNEAQKSHSILFFDETDALFSKRSEVKDSKDKYANIEVSYLLQKMEEYVGISIMASNYIQNIDEAFFRRINYVVKFPFPDAEHREKIWRSVFPKEAPLSEDIDFKYLAKKMQIAGGNIKNVAFAAAFLAAEKNETIKMTHLIHAAKYELEKTGKVLLKEDLGEYFEIFE